MKKNDIESFLRENKPQVKESQTFLLEVQQKMRSVEGVKNEVDRQRKYGKFALVVTLITGVVVGALGVTLAYMYPFDTDAISSGVISDIRLFLDTYKQHLLLPIAICASCLGILLARQKAG
jgi:hypothetical protein